MCMFRQRHRHVLLGCLALPQSFQGLLPQLLKQHVSSSIHSRLGLSRPLVVDAN